MTAIRNAGSVAVGPAVSIDGFGLYLLTYTSTDAFPFGGDLNVRGRFGRLS